MFITVLFVIAKICEQPKYIYINKWLDKQTVVYRYKKILLSNKKKQIVDKHDNISESQNYDAEWKKPD